MNNNFYDRPPEERASIMEDACERGDSRRLAMKKYKVIIMILFIVQVVLCAEPATVTGHSSDDWYDFIHLKLSNGKHIKIINNGFFYYPRRGTVITVEQRGFSWVIVKK